MQSIVFFTIGLSNDAHKIVKLWKQHCNHEQRSIRNAHRKCNQKKKSLLLFLHGFGYLMSLFICTHKNLEHLLLYRCFNPVLFSPPTKSLLLFILYFVCDWQNGRNSFFRQLLSSFFYIYLCKSFDVAMGSECDMDFSIIFLFFLLSYLNSFVCTNVNLCAYVNVLGKIIVLKFVPQFQRLRTADCLFSPSFDRPNAGEFIRLWAEFEVMLFAQKPNTQFTLTDTIKIGGKYFFGFLLNFVSNRI